MSQDISITRPARGFEVSEFERRCIQAQRAMAERGIDALLLTSEPEVRYFSGFLTQFWQSPTRPWFLVLPGEGRPIAVIPRIGEALMRTTWLDDVRVWDSPDPEDDGLTLLGETIGEALSGSGTLGLCKGAETHLRMPLGDFECLRNRLADCRIVDATAIIRRLRMIKSEAEIEKIAYICNVASAAFERVPSIVHEGQPLAEVFRSFKIALLAAGADDVAYLVGDAGPDGYGDIIAPPSDRPLARGDVFMLDTGSVFDGYFCDFDRNFAVGAASDAARRTHEVLYDATEAGLAASRPGTTCADLFRAMQGVIEAAGGGEGSVGRLGHGLGMQLTEWPSHTPWDMTVLEEGMVITLEPGMALDGGRIMVHEENIVIRAEAPQLLTRRAPRELPVI